MLKVRLHSIRGIASLSIENEGEGMQKVQWMEDEESLCCRVQRAIENVG